MALTKIDDRGLKTPIDLLDNEKIRLGTGNDIEFYHDGSNSKIVHSGTGGLYIGADTFGLQNGTTDENYIVMSDNGSVDIYHDNVKVFNTDANGIMVKGPEGGTANIYIYADEGDDNDDKFQLTVDNGGPFHIQNRGSGSVETNIKCYGNGAVELYYDNTLKFGTDSAGVYARGDLMLNYADNYKIKLGAGNDLQIYHDGSNTYLDNTTGDVYLRQNGTENSAKFIKNGGVELYHNDSKKFETTSSGATITGGLYCSAGQQIQITGSAGSVGLQLIGQDADYSLIGTMGAHDLMFRTSSAERMRIAANGVLWHGVAPFANHFSNRSAYFHKSGSSDWNYVSITGGTSGGAGIVFGDSVENNTGNYESLIAHDNANNSLYLKTAQTAKGLEIKADGDVNVIDGNLSFAAGHGIDFSHQTPTSETGASSDDELFNHYEEGDWTPTPIITHQGGTGALSNIVEQYGRYVRSGRYVRVWFHFKFTAANITNCNVGVSGLPFTITNDAEWNNSFHGGIARRGTVGGETYICEGMYKNNTQITVLRKYDNYGFTDTTQSVGGTACYLVD